MKTRIMIAKFKYYLSLLSVLIIVFSFQNLEAQTSQSRSQDSIDTQVVTIVKPYTPRISDAFKLKQTPTISISENSPKSIKYTIFNTKV